MSKGTLKQWIKSSFLSIAARHEIEKEDDPEKAVQKAIDLKQEELKYYTTLQNVLGGNRRREGSEFPAHPRCVYFLGLVLLYIMLVSEYLIYQSLNTLWITHLDETTFYGALMAPLNNFMILILEGCMALTLPFIVIWGILCLLEVCCGSQN